MPHFISPASQQGPVQILVESGLSIAFGTSSESWLNQQTQYDLWHAEQHRKQLRVAKLAPA